ncbi:hypothetical protein ERO13_D07G041825v2, partial [Gossypium hirsutum]
HYSVRLFPIVGNSPLLLSEGVWVMSQSHLVLLFPHQLINQMRALPQEGSSFCSSVYRVLAIISHCCSPPNGKVMPLL